MSALRMPSPVAGLAGPSGRTVDLSGEAVHLFRFGGPLALAYEYFCDVPAVFRLLPDTLEVFAYGPNRYRLIVGASDGHGHAMAAVFDMHAIHEAQRAIRIVPAEDGPPVELSGMVFAGALYAEAVFVPHASGTDIEYAIELAMAIPVPNVLRLMPSGLLQTLGERAMEHKITQMIGGFTRAISADFHAWANGG